MNAEIKDGIFTLLYAMVLIDRRVVKVEMDTFFATVEDLLETIEDVENLRAKDVVANWFMRSYKTVLKEMKTPGREEFMLAHVETLKAYSHRRQVFHIMNIIAHADEHFHDEERKFLNRVAHIWGLEDSHETLEEE